MSKIVWECRNGHPNKSGDDRCVVDDCPLRRQYTCCQDGCIKPVWQDSIACSNRHFPKCQFDGCNKKVYVPKKTVYVKGKTVLTVCYFHL